MKRVECVIRPHLVDEVKKALQTIGITGMTLIEVKGFGRQKGHKEIYRGVEYQVDFVPKLKIELVIPDELLVGTLEAIAGSARTGKFGDGKIFVSTLEDAVRIRTGEHGTEAL